MGICFEILQPTLFVEVNTCGYRELGKYVLILFCKINAILFECKRIQYIEVLLIFYYNQKARTEQRV